MRVLKLAQLFALILMVLSQSPASAVTLSDSQVLRLGNGSEPKELDPSRATGAPEGKILDGLFEGLVNLDQKVSQTLNLIFHHKMATKFF